MTHLDHTDSEAARDYWLDQAEIARAYAASRPASDISGYVEAMFDAREFERRAGGAA